LRVSLTGATAEAGRSPVVALAWLHFHVALGSCAAGRECRPGGSGISLAALIDYSTKEGRGWAEA
jgi:hypothetical protein